MHRASSFVTLTYNDEHLPSDGSLDVEHWQLFAKRLRKNVGRFRFFHCGEYGELGRPHYHACIFGIDFVDDRKFHTNGKHGDPLFTSQTLDKVWGKGYAIIGDVTFQSAGYVARYCMKKRTGPDSAEHYERVNEETGEVYHLTPEYNTMSRRPGIGQSWLRRYQTDVYPSDEVIVNGKKCRPPKYYDAQLERQEPEVLASIKRRREAKAAWRADDNTWERLRVREEIAHLRVDRLIRE